MWTNQNRNTSLKIQAMSLGVSWYKIMQWYLQPNVIFCEHLEIRVPYVCPLKLLNCALFEQERKVTIHLPARNTKIHKMSATSIIPFFSSIIVQMFTTTLTIHFNKTDILPWFKQFKQSDILQYNFNLQWSTFVWIITFRMRFSSVQWVYHQFMPLLQKLGIKACTTMSLNPVDFRKVQTGNYSFISKSQVIDILTWY